MNPELEASRRKLLLGGVAAGAGLILPGRLGRALAQTLCPTSLTPTPDASTGGYYSMLGPDGLMPKSGLAFADKTNWQASCGATWVTGMDHSIRRSAGYQRIRFEVRDTVMDKTNGDELDTRRSELKNNIDRLYNDIDYWGALSFIHYRWADPAGMAQLFGGVYMQLHMGDFGGSPAVAFRRHKTGDFLITTRGQKNTANTKRYLGPLAWDTIHDIVYRVRCNPTSGQLDVWLNGAKIVGITKQSIGSNVAGYRPYVGCYFSGGITCPIIAEVGNYVYPGTVPLDARITNCPAWPSD